MTPDSGQLLRAYADERSEDAFRAIVERHLRVVYTAALRQVGDRGLAEEITQNVFTALARKPNAFRGESTLSSWLYKAAVFQASRCIRTELRRKRREQIALDLGTIAGAANATRDDLGPLLDEALLSLREVERAAVVLHFFEELPFREVGRALGIGEDAARKRVGNAVDTLIRFFQQRGFAVSALSLGESLGIGISKAVPAGLTGMVARTALNSSAILGSAATFLSFTKIITFMKPLTIVICVILVAVPIAFQTRGLAKAKAELSAEQDHLENVRQGLAAAEEQNSNLVNQVAEARMGFAQQPQQSAMLFQSPAKPGTNAESDYYPWEPNSKFVRVPKKLFDRIAIPSFTAARFGQSGNELNEPMMDALRMTADEAEAVRSLWSRARTRYAELESAHMHPIDLTLSARAVAQPLEGFSFKLDSFPEESRKLKESFEAGLTAVLGGERAQIFWLNGSNVFYGLIRPFDMEAGPLVRKDESITITYQLTKVGQISKQLLILAPNPNGQMAESLQGIPLSQADEQFEPVIVQSILAKWHQWQSEGKVPTPPTMNPDGTIVTPRTGVNFDTNTGVSIAPANLNN